MIYDIQFNLTNKSEMKKFTKQYIYGYLKSTGIIQLNTNLVLKKIGNTIRC